MINIITQPIDSLTEVNNPWSASIEVEGGVISRTELDSGEGYKNRTFITKGSNNTFFTSAYDKGTQTESKTMFSTTSGFTWEDYILPDLNTLFPYRSLILDDGTVIISTNSFNQNLANKIYENKVLKQYTFKPVQQLLPIKNGTANVGAFCGDIINYTSGQIMSRNKTTGVWDIYAALPTDTCPNSTVQTNDGLDWLVTYSSALPSSINCGLFKAPKNFNSRPTRVANYTTKTSVIRVSPTRIVWFNFQGTVTAKYSDNDGLTWTTYSNLPPITGIINSNWIYYNGHCYVSSGANDRTVYHSYNDGVWEAIEITELDAGSIAVPMNISNGVVFYSAIESDSAAILRSTQSVSYNYELNKVGVSSPIDTLNYSLNTTYTYNQPNGILSEIGDYFITVSDGVETINSDEFTISITDDFRITKEPIATQNITEGRAFEINCKVAGGDLTSAYEYRVFKDDVLISTTHTMDAEYTYGRIYTVMLDAGTYRIEITNNGETLITIDSILIVFEAEVPKPTWTHDNFTIVDRSLSGLKLSPIEKCYNEFLISSHLFGNKYLGEIGIYNVDQPEFPIYSDGSTTWLEENTVTYNYTENGLYTNDGLIIYCTVNKTLDPDLVTLINANLDKGWKWNVSSYGEPRTIECEFMEIGSEGAEVITYRFARSGGDIQESSSNFYFYIRTVQMENTNEFANWKDFVTGVDDYVSAKDLWQLAHSSYVLNKRIRKAPTDRTNLKYAIETNFLDGPKTNTIKFPEFQTGSINYEEYSYQYILKLVEWSTKQKLQINYSIPVTKDTIKIELLDNVYFHDAIITPDIGEFGKGWITSIQLDPKKNEFKLGITFETLFFIPPTVIDQCYEIIEKGYNLIDIVESGDRDIDVVEGQCP